MRFINTALAASSGFLLVVAAPPVINPSEIQIMFTYPNGSTTDFITVPDREQWFPIGSGSDVGHITIKPKEGKNVRCQFISPERDIIASPALTHQDTIIIDPRQTVELTRCQSA
ncbi:hypothetical protein V2G26_002793 [Clonostachys chloroleuca]|uniref:Uncharacterized protein n=1 Tax=Clonostachys chloroleuca TaxID=1926264 RepID=A0AA35Q9W0_9HYPO|nr:unnamed protein product [Clonostachys chloroleuca]